MATITLTVSAQCHADFISQAREDITGLGVTVADSFIGMVVTDTLSVDLDSNYLWDVNLRFRGAAPILFEGFNPGAGGDLLTLLSAQGWVAL
jgi:hypothetical protein